jgi:hypothetical protein
MPTNLKFDTRLIDEAVKLGHFKSREQTVNVALREFVQRRQRLRILDLGARFNSTLSGVIRRCAAANFEWRPQTGSPLLDTQPRDVPLT